MYSKGTLVTWCSGGVNRETIERMQRRYARDLSLLGACHEDQSDEVLDSSAAVS